MLTRDAILSRVHEVATTVDVPQLGGAIGIRRLSFAEAMELAEAGRHVDDGVASQETFMVRLIVTCACDGKGRRLFRDGDSARVARLPALALQRIADAALSANGLTGEAIEDTVGNSAAIPGAAGS